MQYSYSSRLISLTCFLAISFYSVSTEAKNTHILIRDQTGIPLVNTTVKIRRTDITDKTDNNGFTMLDLPLGTYIIDVEAGKQTHFHQQFQVLEEISTSKTSPLIISLEEETEHKILVHANPLEHTALDMATPIIILSGEELINKKASTLGEILRLEPGLNVSSFGPAVSRPVIRGLSGARVKITSNQMSVQDASTNSSDHDVGVEPLLSEQIEVVKGPATLLYGSGAIGGVVNTTDRKINPDMSDDFTGGLEWRLGNSTTGEKAVVATLDGGSESWNWHLDAYSTHSDDIEIPGFSESTALMLQEEAEESLLNHSDTRTEEHGFGILHNSKSDSKGASLGATLIFEKGYIGASIAETQKNYGVPGHAEHEDEHLLDNHEENEHSSDDIEIGVGINMSQTRYDIQSEIYQPNKQIDKLFMGFTYTDYQHQEIEGLALGTQFTNKAKEFRSYLKHHELNGWLGVLGIQIASRDFSALGVEAITPPSVTKNNAIYWLEEKHFGNLKWELGTRYESQSIDMESELDKSNSGFSFSFGSVYSLSKHNKLAVNLSHAVRFPSVEEYYSFGPHLATQSFEIGNPNLDNESSKNFDFSYRFESQGLTGELNLFVNQFDNFIFAEYVDEFDSCFSSEVSQNAEEQALTVVCYKQQDANYKGVEIQLSIPLATVSAHEFQLDLFADKVATRLRSGEYLPRIPSSKIGAIIGYDFNDFSTELTWVYYFPQGHLAKNELKTEGFEQLDINIAYRLALADNDMYLFLKGKNLLNEDARDHSSFVKDLAPRAARNFVFGLRYTF